MFGGVLKLTVSYFRNSKSENLTLLDAWEKLLGDGCCSISISMSESHLFWVLEPICEELFWRAGPFKTFNFAVGGDTKVSFLSFELDSGFNLLFTGEMSKTLEGIGVSTTSTLTFSHNYCNPSFVF